MSDYTIETIELTGTSRLRVVFDQDALDPRKDWDTMLTGFVKIDGRGDSRRGDVEPVHEAPIPIAEAHDRFYGDTALSRWAAQLLTERWAWVFHGLHIEYDSEHGGYWFVDRDSWAEGWDAPADGFTLEHQAEIIEGERETYRQWAEGEVYGVILERQVTEVTYRAERTELGFEIDTTHQPVVADQWDEVEAIWGCYLDDDYTAHVVASEHFPLTQEEADALDLPGRRETPREAVTGMSGEW